MEKSELCHLYGEGKTELEISHLATNSAKKQFGQELSMDTKRSRSKYKEEEDILDYKVQKYNQTRLILREHHWIMYLKSPDINLLWSTLDSKDPDNVIRTQSLLLTFFPCHDKRAVWNSRCIFSELSVQYKTAQLFIT